MLALILFIAICALILAVFVALFGHQTRNKISICHLSLNKMVYGQYTIFKDVFDMKFSSDTKLVVIPDDFEFMDKNFYWPCGYGYLHLSDMLTFINENMELILKENPMKDLSFRKKLNAFIHENVFFVYD